MVLSLLQVCNLLSSIAMVLIRGSPVLRDVLEICVCVCGGVFYGCPVVKSLSWHLVSGESGGWMSNIQVSLESQITVSCTADF